MKNRKLFKWQIVFCLIITICALSFNSYAQKKYAPGTIHYPDGSYKLPNGTIVYPDGRRTYPKVTVRYRPAKSLPPGQAKKLYGVKSAREFAPGHQKKTWKKQSKHWK